MHFRSNPLDSGNWSEILKERMRLSAMVRNAISPAKWDQLVRCGGVSFRMEPCESQEHEMSQQRKPIELFAPYIVGPRQWGEEVVIAHTMHYVGKVLNMR